jgi:hypothetical protein
MESTDKRIHKLEKELRLYRRILMLIIPAIFLFLFAGFYGADIYQKVVKASRFEVIDDYGEPVVVIDQTGLVILKNLAPTTSDKDYVHIIPERFSYKIKTGRVEIYDGNTLIGKRDYVTDSVVDGSCWSSEITIGGTTYYWNCNSSVLKYMGVTFIGKAQTDKAALQMAINHYVNVVYQP